MSAFDDFESQDLGQDFVFETDPNSLQRILDNRELSPRSVLAMRMSSKLIQPTLSPAKGAPKQVRDNPERFDFFESKKGDVFWRPKTPKAKVTGGSSTKTQLFGQRQRALGRVAINALPQRSPSPTPIIKEIEAKLLPQEKEKELVDVNEVIKTPTRTKDKDVEKEIIECDFVGKLFSSFH